MFLSETTAKFFFGQHDENKNPAMRGFVRKRSSQIVIFAIGVALCGCAYRRLAVMAEVLLDIDTTVALGATHRVDRFVVRLLFWAVASRNRSNRVRYLSKVERKLRATVSARNDAAFFEYRCHWLVRFRDPSQHLRRHACLRMQRRQRAHQR